MKPKLNIIRGIPLLNNGNAWKLIIAQLISSLGDFAFIPAIQIWIYKLTGSGIVMSLFFTAHYIPKILFTVFWGHVADNKNKKLIMVCSDILRFLALFILLLVKTTQQIYLLYIVSFILSTFSQSYQTASSSIIPQLFKETSLVKVNSLLNGVQSFGMIVGPIIGTFAVTIVNIYAVIIINAISFLGSSIILWTIVYNHDSKPTIDSAKRRADIKEFKKLLSTNKLLRVIVIIVTMTALALGVQNVGFIFFVKNVMNQSDKVVGFIVSSQGMGSIFGSIIGTIIFKKDSLNNRIVLLSVSYFLASISIITYLLIPKLGVVLFLTFVEGVVFCWIFTLINTVIQENFESGYTGKVFGVVFSIESIFMLLSMGVGGFLIEELGIFIIYFLVGLDLMIISLVSFLSQKYKVNLNEE